MKVFVFFLCITVTFAYSYGGRRNSHDDKGVYAWNTSTSSNGVTHLKQFQVSPSQKSSSTPYKTFGSRGQQQKSNAFDDNGLPTRVLEHPTAQFRSDIIQGQLADDDESFNLYKRKLYYDIPKDEKFGSKEAAMAYLNADKDIRQDVYLRKARLDKYQGPLWRHYQRSDLYENNPESRYYGNAEIGNHITDLSGSGTGNYRRQLSFQNGEENGSYVRAIDYRSRPEFDDKDDGEILPDRSFFTNYGRFGSARGTKTHSSQAKKITFGLPHYGSLSDVRPTAKRYTKTYSRRY